MLVDSVVSPFRIDEKEYGSLLESQLAKTAELGAQAPSDDLQSARKLYLRSAIAKSVDLTDIASRMAPLTAEELVAAASVLPDKEAMGWENKIASITPAHREGFAAAAEQRTLDMLWENLFPEGTHDIVLPFLEDSAPVEDEIADLIVRWNAHAKEAFRVAHEQDLRIQRDNPEAKPVAGADITQQQIHFDPEDPSKLQTYKPRFENGIADWDSEDNWKPGPRFGKFLQDQHEWRLYEIYHDKTNDRKKQAAANEMQSGTRHAPTLEQLANHAPLNADAFEPESLRIVLSRDPQKIGEMSTGQRWNSCMATNGCHHHHVVKDIEEGTLVAYVVHKDDPEARYPLMRVLLKPYRNGAGETILIPAKIYGGDGDGNARTRAGFLKTLNHYAASTVNAGKVGQFRLAEGLYDDGQPSLIQVQEHWTSDILIEAMLKFQQGALEEWLTEYRANRTLLRLKKKAALPPNEKTPAQNIDILQKKIRHVFDAADTKVGLPRMFYREMLKSALGSLPPPRDILAALANENTLTQRQKAFAALGAGDLDAWKTITKGWSPENCCQTALAFIVTNESSKANVLYAAAAAYVNDVEACLQNQKIRGNATRRYTHELKKLALETSWENKNSTHATLSGCLESISAYANMEHDEKVRMGYTVLHDKCTPSDLETAESIAHAEPFRDPYVPKQSHGAPTP